MKLVRAKKGYRKVGDKYLLAKRCTKCGKWLVANTINFRKSKTNKYGLYSQCRKCERKQCKQWKEANKDKVAKYNKQWREANPKYGKQWQETNKDKVAEYNKRYREANKEKVCKLYKQWREANPEYYKQYCEANREKELERKRQWRKANPEYYKQYGKQYRQSPQGQVVAFNARNKRRHKKANQGTGVTPDQWLEMMQYFDFRCAYTGERLTDKTRSGDHIVPIDAGGDDMVWNMVPMLRNLNSSKQAKDMLEWYKEQNFYSEARLAKIYEWQEYARKKWKK